MFYYLKNLSAHEAFQCEPWHSEATVPPLADKNAYRTWCHDPGTDHAFISAVEGKVPSLRVSDTNPPTRMCGLILDYDAVPDVPPEQSIIARAPSDLRPAWVSRTFSGHCRVLYQFEEPVPLFTRDIGREFVLKCQRELKLKKLLAGFEPEALLDFSKYYEIGRNWTPIGNGSAYIRTSLLMAWLADASSKHKWEREGPVIPIDVIREECMTRFPDRWPSGWSSFEVGSRGPRFWDISASDPTAAIVRESGVQFYSDGGGFMTWEAILGSQFVRRWADDRIGTAIQNFFYDGRDYWTKNLDGVWVARLERDVVRELFVDHRLFKKSPGGNEPSEVEKALRGIARTRFVETALPVVYRPDGLLTANGMRCLNTSTRRPVSPVGDVVEWGEGFPKIANFLDLGFPPVPGVNGEPDPLRQRSHLLSWIRHAYLGALGQEPARGLALFIAGPAGTGKNLLNRGIVGRLMGGCEDASKYLLEGDKFNDPLFSVGHWCVDDAIAAGDDRNMARFSQMVKQVVANDALVYRRMFVSGRSVEWVGRVCITLNDDPESLRILPQTDINILDKIMLLLMRPIPVPGWEMTDAEIDAELPFFAAFLRDSVPPEYCTPTNPRFGVAAYAHPDLLEVARNTSALASFEELINLWRADWFGPGGIGESDAQWTGNPSQLWSAIERNEQLRTLLRQNCSTSTWVGRRLNGLIRSGCSFIGKPTKRTYSVARPAQETANGN